MNRARRRAGSATKQDTAARGLRMLCSLLVLAALAGGAAAQTSDEFARGVSEFNAKNFGAAAEHFARAEGAAPGTTDALLYEGKALVHLEQFTTAESALRQYLSLHEDSA